MKFLAAGLLPESVEGLKQVRELLRIQAAQQVVGRRNREAGLAIDFAGRSHYRTRWIVFLEQRNRGVVVRGDARVL